jgi:signal transduction histidine kinase
MSHQQPNPSKEKLINPVLSLTLLPLQALFDYLNVDKIAEIKAINAAIINISGRQRMLSQRIAFYALRLVHCDDFTEQNYLRQELLNLVELMDISHQALLSGDWSMKVSSQLSSAMERIYFASPYFLDTKVNNYLNAVRELIKIKKENLNLNNPHLQYILKVASKELLETLDLAVSQYQKEKEEQELEIEIYQRELDHKNFTATAIAMSQANELKATLEQLKITQLQLIQSEKMASLGQLLAGIGHEINNPLNFVIGNLDYLEQYSNDLLELVNIYQETAPEVAEKIGGLSNLLEIEYLKNDFPKVIHSLRFGSEKIKEIIDNLQVFSHQQNTKSNLVDIHQCLNSSISILKHRFKQNGKIKLIKNYGDLPLVECYAGQISQVFLNIINNAIDELETTGVIAIKTSANLTENYVSISIKDNGNGIKPDVQTKIFDPFFTTKPVGKGTGLGLSISYEIIVKRHGGSIKCISQPQEGTEFLITIPIH